MVDAIVDAGVTYTPNDDYNGADTLTITDTDSFGGSCDPGDRDHDQTERSAGA